MSIEDADVWSISPLFVGSDDRKRWDDFLTVALSDALQRVCDGAACPTADMAAFRQTLGTFDFTSPLPLSDLLPWVIGQMEHGIVHLTHGKYLGLFNPSPSFPAECAERIVAAFNPQLATSTTSPVPVEIEAHVIRSVAQRAGFPRDAGGHFTTGGSEANLTALICALTRATPMFGQTGVTAFTGPPTLYVSEDAHLAWYKIAHQTGIGRAAVRLIATDAFGQMDPRVLADTIEADKASGRVPVMIVATAGTTGAGMIDPLAACADVARASDTWFHVDAAWGGALIASDKLRSVLAGIDAADSITIDAHKWFATTMSCGMFITRHAAVLSECFRVETSYMPSNNPGVDPYITTTQWSRRFLGLRLFLSLASVGWQGHAAHVERSIRLADMLKEELTANGWRIVNRSPLAVLCSEPPPGFPTAKTISREIVGSGKAWVSTTMFRGREVVRMCVTNGQTMPEDVRAMGRLLQSFKLPMTT